MQRLDRFTTGYSNAVSINNAGQVLLTGVPRGAGGSPESFIWEGGLLTGVGPIEGTAIGASGDVIGYELGPLLDLQSAKLWRVGSLRPLSGPSGERVLPLGINASSQVVGWMAQTPGSERAFVWDNGEMLDLNERIAPDFRLGALACDGDQRQGPDRWLWPVPGPASRLCADTRLASGMRSG